MLNYQIPKWIGSELTKPIQSYLSITTNNDNTFHRTRLLTSKPLEIIVTKSEEGVSRVRHAFTPFFHLQAARRQPTFAQVRLISTCLARNTAQHRPASLYLVSASSSPPPLPPFPPSFEEKVTSGGCGCDGGGFGG